MQYPIAIERGDEGHAYGVVIPDLPGCFSAGDTLEEALDNTRQAILLHLQGLLEAGEPWPVARPMSEHVAAPDYQGWIWFLVDVDLSQFDDVSERINITLPRLPTDGQGRSASTRAVSA